jgi:LysM repeat protein
VDAIARRYGLTGTTLRQVNNLQVNRKNRLTASQPILVPGRGKPAGQVAAARSKEPPAPAAPAGKSQPARKGATGVYTVKAGDTLYGIARQFGRAVPDLLHLNNLAPSAVIQPGLRLRVY